MTVGSVWNMEMYMLFGTTLATLDTMETGTSTSTAVEKANLTSGEEVVKFKYDATITLRRPDPLPDTTYTTTSTSYVREAGDWIFGYSTLDDSTADTMMATNPSVGKTWHQGTATAEVISQEDVTVKAGTYKSAWKVKMTSTSGGVTTEIFLWYAKGTGLVKMHFEGTTQGYTTIYNDELTSATIK